jgi:beta-lactamase regulating signal transducer with metallopeptidase domain
MTGIAMIESVAAWLARNALLTLVPALLIAWVCWMRWGSARVRWILVGLLLLKLVTPGLPGWSWNVLGLDARGDKIEKANAQPEGFMEAGSDAVGTVFEVTADLVPDGLPWWALVWALGVFGLGVLWGVEVWRVNRVIRTQRVAAPSKLLRLVAEECRFMGVSDCPEVCVLRGWGQAAVHGCWRARLLLPATWLSDLGDDELRAVLRHELAHVRRKDVLWSTLGYAVAAMHWFHPLGWLGLRRLRAEAELLCDEAALMGHGEAERKEYGRVLIRMMETFSSSPPNAVAAFARHRNDIQHRILMIAQPNRAQRWSRAVAWLILPTVSLAMLTAGERENPRAEGRNDAAERREIERLEVRELEKRELSELESKERERSGTKEVDRESSRKDEATEKRAPRESERDGDRPREGGARDGDRPKEGGARDGEQRKEGPRDGEMKKEGARDGDRPKEGQREGEKPREGDRPREGMREGDRPKEGMREGERGKEGTREGERSKEGMREGEGSERSARGPSKAPPMVIQLNAGGEVVNSEGRVIPDAEVKERIGQLARSRPGQEVVLRGEKETRYESLVRVLTLLRGMDVKPTLGQ